MDNDSISQLIHQWCSQNKDIKFHDDIWKGTDWISLISDKNGFKFYVTSLLVHDKVSDVSNYISKAKKLDELVQYINDNSNKSDADVKTSTTYTTPTNLTVAFDSEYRGNSVKIFKDHVDDCYAKWIKKDLGWHSPYTAIVQSSGYGKSRMCKQFACTESEWLTVYICLRSAAHDTGYPEANRKAIDFLSELARSNVHLDEKPLVRLVKQWMDAWRWIRIAFHYSFFQDTSKDSKQVLDRLKSNIANLSTFSVRLNMHSISVDMANELKERIAFWKLCEDQSDAEQLHEYVEHVIQAFEKRETHVGVIPKIKAFFVMDEAQFLLNAVVENLLKYNMFRAFRAALGAYKRNVFAVLVDTTSQVGNFLPPTGDGASNRIAETDTGSTGTILFPPFYQMATMDALCDNLDTDAVKPFLLGRPLWKSTYDTSAENNLNELALFARNKLIKNDTETVAIAILAVVTGMNISPKSTIASRLVSSYMATCLGIEEDREVMFISYPVEPILAEEALYKLTQINNGNQLHTTILQHLVSHLRIGTTNPGFTGELVVKLLLLLARGRASERFELCTLKKYLNELVGNCNLSAITVDTQEYKLSFTCFTAVMRWGKTFENFWKHKYPQQILEAFFARRAALEFPKNQPGADLLIPVRVGDSQEFRYILVQVKNVASPNSVKAIETLSPDIVFGAKSRWCQYDLGFALLVNVGCPSKKSEVLIHDSNILEIKGMNSFAKLSSETIDQLGYILREYSVENCGTAADKDYIMKCEQLCDKVLNGQMDDEIDDNVQANLLDLVHTQLHGNKTEHLSVTSQLTKKKTKPLPKNTSRKRPPPKK